MAAAKLNLPKEFPYDPTQPLGMVCEVFGVTGEKWTGKTFLTTALAPGDHPEGHPFAGMKRTLYLDFEKSGANYGGHVERVDVSAELLKMYPKGWTPTDVFVWFQNKIHSIPPGRYDAAIADPITDVENGLLDYVRANNKKFGISDGQLSKMSGLVHSAAQVLMKRLLVELASRAKIFAFTAHMKTEWKNNKPTATRIAKGSGVMYEVATLYLELGRDMPTPENPKIQPPYAKVLKDRLAFTIIDDEGDVIPLQVLPPRIPVCTPKGLRAYVKKPIGARKELAPEELIVEPGITDDERQLIQLEIEHAKRDTASFNAQQAQLALEAAQQAAELARQQQDAAVTNDGYTADPAPQVELADKETIDEIKRLTKELEMSKDDIGALFKPWGIAGYHAVTPQAAVMVLTELGARLVDRNANTARPVDDGTEGWPENASKSLEPLPGPTVEKPAHHVTEAAPPAEPAVAPSPPETSTETPPDPLGESNAKATSEQVAHIELAVETLEFSPEQIAKVQGYYKVTSWHELTHEQAAENIRALNKRCITSGKHLDPSKLNGPRSSGA